MPASSTHAKILCSIDESNAQIRAAIIDIQETVLISRTLIEVTRGWLRELDRLFPAQ